jgi:hypothetical protein
MNMVPVSWKAWSPRAFRPPTAGNDPSVFSGRYRRVAFEGNSFAVMAFRRPFWPSLSLAHSSTLVGDRSPSSPSSPSATPVESFPGSDIESSRLPLPAAPRTRRLPCQSLRVAAGAGAVPPNAARAAAPEAE